MAFVKKNKKNKIDYTFLALPLNVLKSKSYINLNAHSKVLLIDIFIQEKDFVNLKKYAYRIINSESDPKLLRNLGATLAQNNIPAIALDSFEKAIRLSPNDKDTYRMAGTFFANLGKYDEAIYLWRIGLSIDPNDQRFRMNIAKAEKLK